MSRRPPASFATRCVHGPAGGDAPGPPPRPTSPPIYLTSAFAFDDAAAMAEVLAGRSPGWSYSRLGNPTRAEVEGRLADLEGAGDAALTSSGMAAISAAILGAAGSGDHVVAASTLYGNTRSLLTGLLARLGIELSTAPPGDPAAARAALRPRTRLLYCETIANPTLEVADLPGWAEVAAGAGLPLVVDNTFATPVLCRPLEHGASLVVHSATKYLSGHGDVLAGVVAGEPLWVSRARAVAADLGSAADPFTAWLLGRGLPTLPLRVERQARTATRIAAWLRTRPEVRDVRHPRPTPFLAGPSGILGLELEGGREGGRRFLDGLGLITRAPTLGDVRSLAVHPASTTHRQLSEAELRDAGIAPGYVRLSVGLEDARDLVADLRAALGGRSPRRARPAAPRPRDPG